MKVIVVMLYFSYYPPTCQGEVVCPLCFYSTLITPLIAFFTLSLFEFCLPCWTVKSLQQEQVIHKCLRLVKVKNCHSLARFLTSRLMLITCQRDSLFSKRPAAEDEDFCFGCIHLSSSAHMVYQVKVRTCILVPRVTLSPFFRKLCTVFEVNDVK